MVITQYFQFCDDFNNPVALRNAKIVCNFGLSECNSVKWMVLHSQNLYLL